MKEETLKRKWAQQDETEINLAIAALLEHVHGRRTLWWLLTIGKVGAQPFANNALAMSFACGELNVGQQILDRIISVSPDGYVRMMKEMADERGQRDRDLADARDRGRDRDLGGDEDDAADGDG